MDEPKKQFLNVIDQSTNILVTVRSNPSIDQLAACIALTLMLNELGKRATAVFSGKVPPVLEFLEPQKTLQPNTDSLQDFIISLDKSKADKLRYKVEDNAVKIFITPYKVALTKKDLEFEHGDFNVDVVVALGVHVQEDIDHAITTHGRILHDATVAILNVEEGTAKDLGNINWLDDNAGSLSEMVANVADELIGTQTEALDNQVATALLTGIVAETNHFGNSKTKPETMQAAAKLLVAGANQELISRKLASAVLPAAPAFNDANDTPAADETAVQVAEPGSEIKPQALAGTKTETEAEAGPESGPDEATAEEPAEEADGKPAKPAKSGHHARKSDEPAPESTDPPSPPRRPAKPEDLNDETAEAVSDEEKSLLSLLEAVDQAPSDQKPADEEAAQPALAEAATGEDGDEPADGQATAKESDDAVDALAISHPDDHLHTGTGLSAAADGHGTAAEAEVQVHDDGPGPLDQGSERSEAMPVVPDVPAPLGNPLTEISEAKESPLDQPNPGAVAPLEDIEASDQKTYDLNQISVPASIPLTPAEEAAREALAAAGDAAPAAAAEPVAAEPPAAISEPSLADISADLMKSLEAAAPPPAAPAPPAAPMTEEQALMAMIGQAEPPRTDAASEPTSAPTAPAPNDNAGTIQPLRDQNGFLGEPPLHDKKANAPKGSTASVDNTLDPTKFAVTPPTMGGSLTASHEPANLEVPADPLSVPTDQSGMPMKHNQSSFIEQKAKDEDDEGPSGGSNGGQPPTLIHHGGKKVVAPLPASEVAAATKHLDLSLVQDTVPMPPDVAPPGLSSLGAGPQAAAAPAEPFGPRQALEAALGAYENGPAGQPAQAFTPQQTFGPQSDPTLQALHLPDMADIVPPPAFNPLPQSPPQPAGAMPPMTPPPLAAAAPAPSPQLANPYQ